MGVDSRLRPEAGHVRHVEEDEHLVRVRLRVRAHNATSGLSDYFPNPFPNLTLA